MYTFLLLLFVIICTVLVITILLQSSKGGGLASSFGGLGGSNVLGPRGAASFLQKATTFLAVAYMLLSLLIGIISRPSVQQDSVIQRELNQMEQPQPLPQLPVAPLEQENGQQNQNQDSEPEQ